MEWFTESVSVNQFRDNLKSFIERVVGNRTPLKVTRRNGEDFVVISADDWEREQETIYVLKNNSLMQQVADSLGTHSQGKGYQPEKEEVSEITAL
ncbi:type II toxin-antitoxin system Phd/YefM family antitoxin [Endozoicomonas sp. 4G]|uniref:type II toxin-antitoxin system Phd/YefM family antitoxin n=1 Tax=Endozoicomonas sp. 4G TaxID=2872754 RepID=UPI002078EACB|nr:type II toxin-antitoxin system Phd/YefM family antitoxin [Endozoicomonas sp. 4G]